MAFTVLPDAAVVAVQGADDAVTLVATGLLDGEPRWQTTLPGTGRAAEPDDLFRRRHASSLFGDGRRARRRRVARAG